MEETLPPLLGPPPDGGPGGAVLGLHGVPHGYPLSLTIFNRVVDTVIQHWVTLDSGEKAGPDGFRRYVHCIAELFYVHDGILTSPQPARLHAALDVLTGLFDRVGLRTNVNKTVGIV